jgi:cardiolipin synthase A/B
MDALLTHGLTFLLSAFLAVIFMIAVLGSLLRQRRSPGATVAWLIFIIFLPPIGLPLYLFFGGRKLEKLSAAKTRIELRPSGDQTQPTDSWPPIGGRLLGSYGLAQPTAGNSIRFHANGEEAFADLIALIDGARESISVQTYEMRNDEVGKLIVERLIAQAKNGVKVRLLLDGLGSFAMSRLALWKMHRAGVSARYFLPAWRIFKLNRGNLRNHRKIAVFDGARVFAGGRNLTKSYLGPTPDPKRWADISFVLEGPSVGDFAKIFNYDWEFTTKEQIPAVSSPKAVPGGTATAQIVPAGPDVEGDPLYAAIISAIYLAQERVWIATPYFVPDASMAQALMTAAKRRVDVRIVVPSKSDQWITNMARGPYLREAREAGAQVMLYTPSMMHGKAVVIDNKLAIAGSANFDQRSMFLNFEDMCLMYSQKEVGAVANWINSLSATVEEGGKPVTTFRDTVESVAFLLTPLL